MTEDGPGPTADRDEPEDDERSPGDREESAEGDGPGSDVASEEEARSDRPDEGGVSEERPPDSGPSAAREPPQPDTEEATRAPAAQGQSATTDSQNATDGRRASQDSPRKAAPPAEDTGPADQDDLPEDVRSYDRFQKMDRAGYDRVNEFLRDRTYITAREWAIARLCADFRTATGVEMTKIGEHLPELVPFMTDTYSPQAVNQARSAFENKVRMAGATFLYGAMSGFFTADELDDLMYEVTEVAKFLLEVEGVELAVEEELAAEDRISSVMREVREASEQLRYDDVECPHCGEAFRPADGD